MPAAWFRSLAPSACAVAVVFAIPGVAHATIVPGDVNEDGAVNLSDPVALLAYLFNSGAVSDAGLLNADVDLSDKVDLADAVYLLDHLFGSPPGPAPLHPPYCPILDPNGNPVSPPQYEAGTYWHDANGVPFAGGFVADTAWPDPADPSVGITAQNVLIPRGTSVCGDTRIASTSSASVEVRLEDTATLRDTTIDVVASTTGAVPLRVLGDSVVSDATLEVGHTGLIIDQSTVSDGVYVHSERGSGTFPILIRDSKVAGTEIHMRAGNLSIVRIERSDLRGGVIESSPVPATPVLIFDSVLEDVAFSVVLNRMDIAFSTLLDTVLTGDLGPNDLEEVYLDGVVDVSASTLIQWCGAAGQLYFGEVCDGGDYDPATCSFPLPTPSWPTCN